MCTWFWCMEECHALISNSWWIQYLNHIYPNGLFLINLCNLSTYIKSNKSIAIPLRRSLTQTVDWGKLSMKPRNRYFNSVYNMIVIGHKVIWYLKTHRSTSVSHDMNTILCRFSVTQHPTLVPKGLIRLANLNYFFCDMLWSWPYRSHKKYFMHKRIIPRGL